IVLVILFTSSFQKRNKFILRTFILVCVSLIVSVIFMNIKMDYWMLSIPFTIIRYIVLFFAVTACIRFCYKVTILTSIFCVTGVYAIQHLIYNLHEIV